MKQNFTRLLRAVFRASPPFIRQLAGALMAPFVRWSLNRASLPSLMNDWQTAHRKPISIVIPSYNDLPLLKKCIRSIRRHTSHFEYEILIIDDFCEARNAEKLKRLESDDVRVVLKDKRMGFAATVNVGIKLARHDVVLLNSDIVALRGWLDALQFSAYGRAQDIGLVSGKLLYPNGFIQYGGTFHAARFAPQWFAHLYAGKWHRDRLANQPAYLEAISGACVYIRREVLGELQGLDEKFWLGFEDVDFALRAWNAGFRCFYEPAATLIHLESASRGYVQGPRELASMRYFWQKWGNQYRRWNPNNSKTVVELCFAQESLWVTYVRQLVESLSGVETREICTSRLDTAVQSAWRAENSLRVVIDHESLESVWLGARQAGFLAHFLSVEGGEEQLSRVESLPDYKSDFAYIAPSFDSAKKFEGLTAWRSVATIAPALRPPTLSPASAENKKVLLLAPKDGDERLHSELARLGIEVSTLVTEIPLGSEVFMQVEEFAPRIVISTLRHDSTLVPLMLMSLGAVFVGWQNPRIMNKVLDGENALLVPQGSIEGLIERVKEVLEDEAAWRELRSNGHAAAQAAHEEAAARFRAFLSAPSVT